MGRFLAGMGLALVAGWIGYLLGTDRTAPPARSARNDAEVHDLRLHIVALEEQLRRVEARLAAPVEERTPGSKPESATAKEETYGKPAADPPPTEEERRRKHDTMRATWKRRVLDAPTDSQRRAALRDASAQLKKHTDLANLRRLYDDVLAEVDPASAVGLDATMYLGHLERGEKNYERADELYRRVESLAPPGSAQQADAIFQLAWSRSFEGDRESARREFERSLTVPGMEPGTRAAAHYALANVHRENGDAAAAERELRRIVELAREHPGHGGVVYYLGLAQKLLPE